MSPSAREQVKEAKRGVDQFGAEGQAMRKMGYTSVWVLVLSLGWTAGSCFAEGSFAKRLGKVEFGAVKKTDVLEVPFLTWGGDVATFYANGGVDTKPDSIFD